MIIFSMIKDLFIQGKLKKKVQLEKVRLENIIYLQRILIKILLLYHN